MGEQGQLWRPDTLGSNLSHMSQHYQEGDLATKADLIEERSYDLLSPFILLVASLVMYSSLAAVLGINQKSPVNTYCVQSIKLGIAGEIKGSET